jgi:aspartyl aminopeptidase
MASARASAEAVSLVDGFLKFVNASPSPFHAVETTSKLLTAAGFHRISETSEEDWKRVAPNGKYFFTRNQSTILAFAVGGKFKRGNGFTMAGAHTDSPCLKTKPVTSVAKNGYLQVGVECYGGGLWYTWFDRDLSLAGRVIVDKGEGQFGSSLVRVDRPILCVPSLAIHLNRAVNTEGFNPNKENHLLPILASSAQAALQAAPEEKSGAGAGGPSVTHHSLLVRMLAKELGVKEEAIRDFELCLYDTQPAALGGALSEFIHSARLDNLMMSYCCTMSLLRSLEDPRSLSEEPNVRLVALFDNEEIGSQSERGAFSRMLLSTMERIHGSGEGFESAVRRSMLISADMAHGVHPNFADKHEGNHRPMLHRGLVIKENCNQRYATSSVSAFPLRELARRLSVPLQEFVVRNDSECGSTIGPMLSANCGVRTVDVGIPQWAMHSIRETCGVGDVELSVRLFTEFFKQFPALDAAFKLD